MKTVRGLGAGLLDEPPIDTELKSGFDGGKARVGNDNYNWALKRSQKALPATYF
jgi:hypothetical protein